MDGITKIYSNGFTANHDVNLVLHEGEILALVGENGAGKTTLMKILFGMESHQGGHIEVNGTTVKINSPLDAIAWLKSFRLMKSASPYRLCPPLANAWN